MHTPDLSFTVVGAEAPAFAAQPLLNFKLHIANSHAQTTIHSVTLRSQIQIAAMQRNYSSEAKARLLDVFGEPARWRTTLRSLLWTHANTVVPQFSGETTIDLPVPCTYDFEVVSTKYFDALEDGDIPLNFLFSGTIFYADEAGNLQVGQISWQKEAAYRLPVTTWREMMQSYYPHSAWLRVHKDIFDQLARYKTARGLPTWDEALAHLLKVSAEEIHI